MCNKNSILAVLSWDRVVLGILPRICRGEEGFALTLQEMRSRIAQVSFRNYSIYFTVIVKTTDIVHYLFDY